MSMCDSVAPSSGCCQDKLLRDASREREALQAGGHRFDPGWLHRENHGLLAVCCEHRRPSRNSPKTAGSPAALAGDRMHRRRAAIGSRESHSRVTTGRAGRRGRYLIGDTRPVDSEGSQLVAPGHGRALILERSDRFHASNRGSVMATSGSLAARPRKRKRPMLIERIWPRGRALHLHTARRRVGSAARQSSRSHSRVLDCLFCPRSSGSPSA
jgi:hypothetical protein